MTASSAIGCFATAVRVLWGQKTVLRKMARFPENGAEFIPFWENSLSPLSSWHLSSKLESQLAQHYLAWKPGYHSCDFYFLFNFCYTLLEMRESEWHRVLRCWWAMIHWHNTVYCFVLYPLERCFEYSLVVVLPWNYLPHLQHHLAAQ